MQHLTTSIIKEQDDCVKGCGRRAWPVFWRMNWIGRVACLSVLLIVSFLLIHGSVKAEVVEPIRQRQFSQPATEQPDEPIPIRLIDQLELPARALVQDGTILLAAGHEHGLWILDIGRPWHPAIWGFHSLSGRGVWGVTIQGNYAFVASSRHGSNETGLYIIDISDLSRPVLVGSCPTRVGARDVAVAGHYAFVADDFNGLVVIDISSVTHPTVVSTRFAGGTAWDVELSNPYIYVAAGWGGLAVFDVTNPAAPVKVGDFQGLTQSEYTTGVSVAGSYAYVAQYPLDCCPHTTWTGMRRARISNPASITEAGSYPTAWATRAVVSRDYVFLADMLDGLKVLRESGPTSFELAASYDTPGTTRDVLRFGNYIYVADDSRLLVFWFAPPVQRTLTPSGGTLASPDDRTDYTFSSGTFGTDVRVSHTPRYNDEIPSAGSLEQIGHSFEVQARTVVTGQPVQPNRPYTIRIQYTDSERGPVVESTLGLYFWNGSEWARDATASVNPTNNTITATPNRFSLWSVQGETNKVFLPMVAQQIHLSAHPD